MISAVEEVELIASAEYRDPLLPPSTHEQRINEDMSSQSQSQSQAARNEPKGSWDQVGFGLISAGLLLLVLPTWYLILTGDLSAMGWYAFHPPLQTLSILFLIFGITPVQPPTPSAPTRESRFDTHQTLILRLTMPLLLLGSTAIWWNKTIRSANHFVTWHGLFGLISVLWMVGQAGMGVGLAWYGKQMFGSESAAKKMYKYHRLSGYVLVGLVLVTAHLAGGYSHWAMKQGTPVVRLLAYWLGPLLAAIGLCLRIQTSKMHFGSSRR